MDAKEVIKVHLKVLKKDEKLVLGLRYMENLSFNEVAEVLEKTPGECVILHAEAMRKIKIAVAQADEDKKAAEAFFEAFDLTGME